MVHFVFTLYLTFYWLLLNSRTSVEIYFAKNLIISLSTRTPAAEHKIRHSFPNSDTYIIVVFCADDTRLVAIGETIKTMITRTNHVWIIITKIFSLGLTLDLPWTINLLSELTPNVTEMTEKAERYFFSWGNFYQTREDNWKSRYCFVKW